MSPRACKARDVVQPTGGAGSWVRRCISVVVVDAKDVVVRRCSSVVVADAKKVVVRRVSSVVVVDAKKVGAGTDPEPCVVKWW